MLDYLKRNRETTVAELSSQLLTNKVETVLNDTGTIYKCLFLLKNNTQLYLKIANNVSTDTTYADYVIEVRVEELEGFDLYSTSH